jgi:hypothetical protein
MKAGIYGGKEVFQTFLNSYKLCYIILVLLFKYLTYYLLFIVIFN